MAKKFGKFLLFTAAVGGAAAAAYYYFQKKDSNDSLSEDEDYDDFSEDLDEETDSEKKYVSLTPEKKDSEKKDSEKDTFIPLDQVAQTVEMTEKDDKSEPEVEEFFDEEDATDEEPPIKDN